MLAELTYLFISHNLAVVRHARQMAAKALSIGK